VCEESALASIGLFQRFLSQTGLERDLLFVLGSYVMSTVAEIESAIAKLSPQERKRLCERLLARETTQKPVLEKLRSLAGKARNLPADLAANHDHYLHGTTKRS